MAERSCMSLLAVLLLVVSGFAQTSIPATPAGRTLQSWLDAFNSGDREKIDAYVKSIDKTNSVDGMLAFRQQTGGFDLLSIESSEQLHIRFRYIDADLAKQMVDAMRAHAAKGEYDSINDGDVFATRLTKDLREVSHDRHLGVNFRPFKMPDRKGPPSAEDEARMHQEMERNNCFFQKVEILPNNIGYINFDAFPDASFCGPTVVAAMGFVAHTDALIFDIRQNGGGQPAMVTMIAIYLFGKPTHLIDIYNRKEDTTTQNWKLSYLPGQRLVKQPVYVLTSKRTFSGAEEFAFDLKNQRRATIVGETTGGGAHPVSGHLRRLRLALVEWRCLPG